MKITFIFNDGRRADSYLESDYNISTIIWELLNAAQFRLENDNTLLKYTYNFDDEEVVDIIETIGLDRIEIDNGYKRVEQNIEVAKFIDRFHQYDDVTRVFTEGCCYWFAVAMHERFPESRIMYAYDRDMSDIPEELRKSILTLISHFVTEIDGRLYDITGDVTGKYKVIPWDEYPDGYKKQDIINESINFKYDDLYW